MVAVQRGTRNRACAGAEDAERMEGVEGVSTETKVSFPGRLPIIAWSPAHAHITPTHSPRPSQLHPITPGEDVQDEGVDQQRRLAGQHVAEWAVARPTQRLVQVLCCARVRGNAGVGGRVEGRKAHDPRPRPTPTTRARRRRSAGRAGPRPPPCSSFTPLYKITPCRVAARVSTKNSSFLTELDTPSSVHPVRPPLAALPRIFSVRRGHAWGGICDALLNGMTGPLVRNQLPGGPSGLDLSLGSQLTSWHTF